MIFNSEVAKQVTKTGQKYLETINKLTTNMKYQDLMYFGYEFGDNSKQYEIDFIKEIKERFPNVELKDAYDNIKGYRQEVYLDEAENDNYWAWLIAFGWLELSLTGQLMCMDKEEDKINKYLVLAKSQYP